jgi:hypothetical protein
MDAILSILMKGGPWGITTIALFAIVVLWKELKDERKARITDMEAHAKERIADHKEQAKLFQRMAKVLAPKETEDEP